MDDLAWKYSVFTLLGLGAVFLLGAGGICLAAGFLLRKTQRKMSAILLAMGGCLWGVVCLNFICF